jgi:hypothetical protein
MLSAIRLLYSMRAFRSWATTQGFLPPSWQDTRAKVVEPGTLCRPWSINLGAGTVGSDRQGGEPEHCREVERDLDIQGPWARTKYVTIPIISNTRLDGVNFAGLYLMTASVHLDEGNVVGATVFRNDGTVAIVDDDH